MNLIGIEVKATNGIEGSLSFAKRLLPILTLYAIASVIGYLLLAPGILAIWLILQFSGKEAAWATLISDFLRLLCLWLTVLLLYREASGKPNYSQNYK